MSPEAAAEEGFVPSSSDTGPVVEEESASTAGCKDAEESKLPCAFYMRTGTCAYVSAGDTMSDVRHNERELDICQIQPGLALFGLS